MVSFFSMRHRTDPRRRPIRLHDTFRYRSHGPVVLNPSSSAQVMHTFRWLRGIKPRTNTLPVLPSFPSAPLPRSLRIRLHDRNAGKLFIRYVPIGRRLLQVADLMPSVWSQPGSVAAPRLMDADGIVCRCRICGDSGQKISAELHRSHTRTRELEEVIFGLRSTNLRTPPTTTSPSETPQDQHPAHELSTAGRQLISSIVGSLDSIEEHTATLRSLDTVSFSAANLILVPNESPPPDPPGEALYRLDPSSPANVAYLDHQHSLHHLQRTVDDLPGDDPYIASALSKLKTNVRDSLERHASLEREAQQLVADRATRYATFGMEAQIVSPGKLCSVTLICVSHLISALSSGVNVPSAQLHHPRLLHPRCRAAQYTRPEHLQHQACNGLRAVHRPTCSAIPAEQQSHTWPNKRHRRRRSHPPPPH